MRIAAPAFIALSKFVCCSTCKATPTIGFPAARAHCTVPCPPWLITTSARAFAAGAGTKRSVTSSRASPAATSLALSMEQMDLEASTTAVQSSFRMSFKARIASNKNSSVPELPIVIKMDGPGPFLRCLTISSSSFELFPAYKGPVNTMFFGSRCRYS